MRKKVIYILLSKGDILELVQVFQIDQELDTFILGKWPSSQIKEVVVFQLLGPHVSELIFDVHSQTRMCLAQSCDAISLTALIQADQHQIR